MFQVPTVKGCEIESLEWLWNLLKKIFFYFWLNKTEGPVYTNSNSTEMNGVKCQLEFDSS